MSEQYLITPHDILVAYIFANALVLLACAAGAWVVWPRLRAGRVETPPAGEGDDPDATVEFVARSRRQRTGTIHAAQYDRVAASERTVVIERTPS